VLDGISNILSAATRQGEFETVIEMITEIRVIFALRGVSYMGKGRVQYSFSAFSSL
jgi:hypothetical protein